MHASFFFQICSSPYCKSWGKIKNLSCNNFPLFVVKPGLGFKFVT